MMLQKIFSKAKLLKVNTNLLTFNGFFINNTPLFIDIVVE